MNIIGDKKRIYGKIANVIIFTLDSLEIYIKKLEKY